MEGHTSLFDFNAGPAAQAGPRLTPPPAQQQQRQQQHGAEWMHHLPPPPPAAQGPRIFHTFSELELESSSPSNSPGSRCSPSSAHAHADMRGYVPAPPPAFYAPQQHTAPQHVLEQHNAALAARLEAAEQHIQQQQAQLQQLQGLAGSLSAGLGPLPLGSAMLSGPVPLYAVPSMHGTLSSDLHSLYNAWQDGKISFLDP